MYACTRVRRGRYDETTKSSGVCPHRCQLDVNTIVTKFGCCFKSWKQLQDDLSTDNAAVSDGLYARVEYVTLRAVACPCVWCNIHRAPMHPYTHTPRHTCPGTNAVTGVVCALHMHVHDTPADLTVECLGPTLAYTLMGWSCARVCAHL